MAVCCIPLSNGSTFTSEELAGDGSNLSIHKWKPIVQKFEPFAAGVRVRADVVSFDEFGFDEFGFDDIALKSYPFVLF